MGSFIALLTFGVGVAQTQAEEGEDRAKETQPALRYLSSNAALEVLTSLRETAHAQDGAHCRLFSYGMSAHGRSLMAMHIGRENAPTVIVHGGLHARDCAGTVACVELARRIVADYAAHTKTVSWLVIPAPNPDALDDFLTGNQDATHKTFRLDRDMDGTRGEDGPHDINGDGVVTEMRVRDAAGTWAPVSREDERGDEEEKSKPLPPGREEVEDAGADARREVSYRLYDEGADLDGDGDIGEDPPSLDLTRNMTGYWTHAGPWGGEGPFPGWAPETKALMDLSHAVTSLVAWYGFTSSGEEVLRANASGKVNDADAKLYKRISAALKKRTGLETVKASDSYEKDNPGCDLDWAGVHLTVPALRIPVWQLPRKPVKATASSSGEAPDADAKKSDAERKPYASWLAWDEAEHGGQGFLPWKAFDHPTLGSVEIGGWRPFTRYEPPKALLGAAVDAVVEGPLVHLDLAPSLKLTVKAKSLGAGVVEVTAQAMNVGEVSTSTSSARKRKRSMGVRVEWTLGKDVALIGGKRQVNVGTLDAGRSSKELRWLVRGKHDAPLGTLTARHRVAGTISKEVRVP